MNNSRKYISFKSTLFASTFAIFLVTSMSITNANALDLSKFGLGDNFGQDIECVVVVVGCDGTGSVGSTGDTTIGSNNGNVNGNDDNNDGGGVNEPTSGSVNAFKNTNCNDENSTAPGEVCSQITNQPEDWNLILFGNGQSEPIVTIRASEFGSPFIVPEGSYSIKEEYAYASGLPQVEGNDVKNVAQFSPGCEGTIDAGDTKTCTIKNTLVYTAQPTTLIVKKIVNCDNSQSPPDVKCDDVSSYFNPGYFEIIVTSQNANPSTFSGSSQGTAITLKPGSYSVREDTRAFPKPLTIDNSGQSIDTVTADVRTPQFSADCYGTIEGGETKTCTITNTVFIYRL